ncbi:MAG: glycosyltransferase family 4 protein, partial [Eubacterium sp.]
MKIAMIGHKRIPSREGGIEIVVEELAVRMVSSGHIVHAYNRKGHHVSGAAFDEITPKGVNEYKGIKLITVPTFQNKKLNAIVYSFFATIRALFGKYDVIHYHAEGPSAMLWLPHLFGIRTVVTIHGLDWQRSKWGGFASKYLKFGERIAARFADEVIVLSENVKEYFKLTYNRDTVFIPNGIVQPVINEAELITKNYHLTKNGYILFLGRLVPEKGLHYLIKAYQNIQTDKKLVIAGGTSHTDEYVSEIKEMAGDNPDIIFTDFIQGIELGELYSNAYIYVLPSDLE